MTVPALLAALFLSPGQDQSPYALAQSIAEPSRLAMTPVLDGVISPDEWDGLVRTPEGETYFQWEPGKLYLAAKMPTDRDLVFSLDTKQNGWLVGKDNLEIRVRVVEGKVAISVRQLDATNVAGPKWIEQPGYSLASSGVAKVDGGTATVEAEIVDPGIELLPIKENEKYMVRADLVAQTSQSVEPFYPRVGTELKLVTQRASALPVGLNWGVEDSGRLLTPGRSTKIRFTFNTKDELGLKKFEIKPVGALSDHASSLGVPFPSFDKKGRAFVDYETKTPTDAPTGYHLLNGTLVTSDGAPAVIQASFRIAPLIDFALENDRIILKDAAQSTKIGFFIRSNSTNRLDGNSEVIPPDGWEITKGDDKGFIIYNSRAGVRRVLTVTIPAGAVGTFPFKFKGQIGQKSFEETRWLTIVAR